MKCFVVLINIILLIILSSCTLYERINEKENTDINSVNEIAGEIDISDNATENNELLTDEVSSENENNSATSDKESNDTSDLISSLADSVDLMDAEEYSWERTEKAEYVVLHFTSAVVNHRDDPYNLEYVRNIFEETYVSIHYIIDREGKIHCWLPETRVAWHAGKGAFGNDPKLTNSMNKYSVGIELLAIGSKNDMKQYLTGAEYDAIDSDLKGFSDKQYESLQLLVRDICTRNNILFDRDHIIGHDMYNPRKNDPGELFDWDYLFNEN